MAKKTVTQNKNVNKKTYGCSEVNKKKVKSANIHAGGWSQKEPIKTYTVISTYGLTNTKNTFCGGQKSV